MRRLHSSAACFAVSLALVLLAPRAAFACPVCFGAGDGPMASGSNIGIAVLLAVTVGVLGGFAAFFASLWRRARTVTNSSPAPRQAALDDAGVSKC